MAKLLKKLSLTVLGTQKPTEVQKTTPSSTIMTPGSYKPKDDYVAGRAGGSPTGEIIRPKLRPTKPGEGDGPPPSNVKTPGYVTNAVDRNGNRIRDGSGLAKPDNTYTTSNPKPGSMQDKEDKGDDSSGGCFLTTALVEYRGEADDGPTLTKLRNFRDTYLKNFPEEIKKYYVIAPQIVSLIPKFDPTWVWVGKQIDSAITYIDKNMPEKAHKTYKDMVLKLETTWLNKE